MSYLFRERDSRILNNILKIIKVMVTEKIDGSNINIIFFRVSINKKTFFLVSFNSKNYQNTEKWFKLDELLFFTEFSSFYLSFDSNNLPVIEEIEYLVNDELLNYDLRRYLRKYQHQYESIYEEIELDFPYKNLSICFSVKVQNELNNNLFTNVDPLIFECIIKYSCPFTEEECVLHFAIQNEFIDLCSRNCLPTVPVILYAESINLSQIYDLINQKKRYDLIFRDEHKGFFPCFINSS